MISVSRIPAEAGVFEAVDVDVCSDRVSPVRFNTCRVAVSTNDVIFVVASGR